MATQLYDLHECHSSTDFNTNKVTKRWVATPKYNQSYAIMRRVKQVYQTDKKYPRGTFFEITRNGEFPDFMKPKIIKT